MKVKIKKLNKESVIPKYASEGDAGMDLTAISKTEVTGEKYHYWEYDTGLSIEIPKGYVGYVFPRSSISKTRFSLCNSVGVIDSGYRGSIKLRFREGVNGQDTRYKVGDRIGQLIIMPYPEIEFEEVENLSDTDRGEGGFGSTG